MLTDVVVDTNVLVDANNPAQEKQNASINLIKNIINSEILLAVDEGFHPIEARNNSQIYSEYLSKLTFGMLGLEMLIELAKTERVFPVSRRVDNNLKREIEIRVYKPVDRIFLRITFNSLKKILISHDFQDFKKETRDWFSSQSSGKICCADEISLDR